AAEIDVAARVWLAGIEERPVRAGHRAVIGERRGLEVDKAGLGLDIAERHVWRRRYRVGRRREHHLRRRLFDGAGVDRVNGSGAYRGGGGGGGASPRRRCLFARHVGGSLGFEITP